jgi:hypothetical protein
MSSRHGAQSASAFAADDGLCRDNDGTRAQALRTLQLVHADRTPRQAWGPAVRPETPGAPGPDAVRFTAARGWPDPRVRAWRQKGATRSEALLK